MNLNFCNCCLRYRIKFCDLWYQCTYSNSLFKLSSYLIQLFFKVTWLASWTENIQNQIKYVMLNPSSRLKGEKDMEKYEKARMLKTKIGKIREDYNAGIFFLKDSILNFHIPTVLKSLASYLVFCCCSLFIGTVLS